MPPVCLPLRLVLGIWGPRTDGPCLCGTLMCQQVKQLGRHFPTVAIKCPEAELEVPAFSGRF